MCALAVLGAVLAACGGDNGPDEQASGNAATGKFHPPGDETWRGCVNAWVRDLVDSGGMEKRLDYWLAQPVT
jgi:hypothetical protein